MSKEYKIIKSIPSQNIYWEESKVTEGNISSITESCIVNLFPEITYQSILGIGGAFTEAAAYNYHLMDDCDKEKFLKAYFDPESGIGYNFGRTHINSCDFSLDIYSYVEDGDKTLETFNIQRDKKYIIPFIKDAMKYVKDELILFASPWSPPAYMKDNENAVNGGSLKEEYKSVWAKYYTKYIKAYMEEGIKISAITIQNEPFAKQTWESCFYSAEDEGNFIKDYLIPALDEANLSDIKIIIWDHNKERVYQRAKKTMEDKTVYDRVWAVGHHWYCGEHFDSLRLVWEQLGKPTISTEHCCPYYEEQAEIFAERYANEMCENFNNFDIATCDWNLVLDQKGGPYHNRFSKDESPAGGIKWEEKDFGCWAPIIYKADKKELLLSPVYYYIGHFSKYIKRGAKRIATTKYTSDLKVTAFLNPDNTICTVIMNTADEKQVVNLRYNDICTNTEIEAHAIMTVIFEK